jgi:tetratricopeptide (TPR) repeat protein
VLGSLINERRCLAVRGGVNGIWVGSKVRLAEQLLLRGVLLSSLSLPFSPCAQAQTARRPAAAASSAPAAPATTATPAAQPPMSSPFDASNAGNLDEAARNRARTLFDKGAQAYNESRYSQAAEYFLDAHRVYPAPQLLFNVAKAYDKLGMPSSAMAFYRDYLRHLPGAPDANEVGSRVRELEAVLAQRGVQQLTVLTTPARALVAVDATPVGVTPWTGETWPGEHRLAVTLDGYKPLETLIMVDAVRARDFSFELVHAAPSNTTLPGGLAPAAKPSPHVSTLTWLVLGVGTAALGTTLAVEMVSKNTSGLSRTGAFFGGVGISASLLGGLLLHLDLYEPDATPTQKRRAVAASVIGRF